MKAGGSAKGRGGHSAVDVATLRTALLERKREAPTLTFAALAEEFGISKTSAYQHIMKAIAELPMEAAEAVRAYELEKLSRYEGVLEPKIAKGDTRAIRVALRIIERRARLLGLDAPKKVAIQATVVAQESEYDLTRLSPEEAWALRQLQVKALPGAVIDEQTGLVVRQTSDMSTVEAPPPEGSASEQKPDEPAVDVELDDL